MTAKNSPTSSTFENELRLLSRANELPLYEFDPFDESFFLEWSLLDVRLVAFRSRIGVLVASWGETEPVNSALLIGDGVLGIHVAGPRQVNELTAWTMGRTSFAESQAGSSLQLLDINDADNKIEIAAKRIEIRLGYCAVLRSPQPDFVDLSPEDAMKATPNWASAFQPTFAAAR
ncbi:hypothetical protein IT072_19825 [Leifsonia sp. ZF2019]|uniref:hypothetical protein n=1 Tax=Leifsonia sp. ZF2019 TaxID=2781978 RepID=UPI001CBD6183|nr:hypothetical protein [Leifsonia sp. ZF2019]UAJ79407.1 hypothetical protein IT072_19825 [Leifsonia sp. ZF2019]